MSSQLYKEIEILISHVDDISKEKIKDTLLSFLPAPCPQCHERHDKINKFGRELDPTTMYDSTEYLYTLCPHCQYIYHYTF